MRHFSFDLGRRPRLLLIWLLVGAGAATARPATPLVEVFHWWVSGGERASVNVIRDNVLAQGIEWKEASVPGSGTARYTKVLAERVRAGKVPMAAQMIGYAIHTWASRGLLDNLDAVAAREEWDAVVPIDIQHLSKYNGHWVAAPFNTHSTNWLWVNQALANRLGVTEPPDTFDDLITLLEKARAKGVVPLAIGKEPWEHTLLFELVAVGVLGASSYRQAFVDLDASALTQPATTTIFERMRLLAGYMDGDYTRRRWDEATNMVRKGQALMQAQGSWVNGEFTAQHLVPDRDYACWRFPDTQGVFLFNSDQYVFFHKPGQDVGTQHALASILMSPQLQMQVNLRTGAAPARVDVSPASFNACGKRAVADMRASNMRRTLMGSIAMGNANPETVKTAIYKVVTQHLKGHMNNQEAGEQLRAAIRQESAMPSGR